MEPPPSVLRADQLRKGGLRGRIRTGAKTATKDQERDYLERFQALADDPSVLVPRWTGSGPDPFAKLRKRLARVQRRRESSFWLKWHGRGKRLDNAYAQTLMILRGGRIPSFASMKFRGRDVKFVLRGRGLRDKLMAVHNFDEPEVRLIGHLDFVRRNRVVLVSLPDDFMAQPAGATMPQEALEAILREGDVELQPRDGVLACPHAVEPGAHLAYDLRELGARLTLCRACVQRLGGSLQGHLERFVLSPGGRLRVTREVTGTNLKVHPEAFGDKLAELVTLASREATRDADKEGGVADGELLERAEAALRERLDERPEGYVQVGNDLWLGEWDQAARQYGADALEIAALATAFRLAPPHVLTSDASTNRLLEPVWERHAQAILAELGGEAVDAEARDELARQRPSDALAALARVRRTEERFAGYPRLDALPPALRLAHDLFKAQRTGDASLFQKRLAEGARDASLKPLALAMARAFNQSAAIEWQYAPHEKDQAVFLEPYARGLALAKPETYVEDLGQLAVALGVARPVPRDLDARHL